jgi:deoxyribonuclease II
MNNFIVKLICISFLIAFTLQAKTEGKCVSPEGKTVSWYIIYLMSNDYNQFVYFDNNSKSFQSYKTVAEDFPPLILVRGLNSGKYNYLAWNDDIMIDGLINFYTSAHSKGIITGDSYGNGSLLMHSLPRFPKIFQKDNTYEFHDEFPDNEGKYAQTFMCMSFKEDEFVKLLSNLPTLKLGFQATKVDLYPDESVTQQLAVLASKPKVSKDRVPFTLELKTSDNQKFVYFGKPDLTQFKLPWDQAIPEYFNSSLFVGTWTRPNLLAEVCTQNYEVLNIQEYNILGVYGYRNSQDHSKWGVTEVDKALCIGDLNRTESQLKRGGGVMCIINPNVSSLAKQFISKLSTCP